MICIGTVVGFTFIYSLQANSLFSVPAPGKDSMKMEVMMRGLLPESTLIRFAKKSLNIAVSNVVGKSPRLGAKNKNYAPCLNGILERGRGVINAICNTIIFLQIQTQSLI
jgi:hypothetical protein